MWLLSSRCVVRGLTEQGIRLLGQVDEERIIFLAGKRKWSAQLLLLQNEVSMPYLHKGNGLHLYGTLHQL